MNIQIWYERMTLSGRAGRSSSQGSSAERPSSGNPYVRQGSLKAWKEEQDRAKADEEEKERAKWDKRARSAQKKVQPVSFNASYSLVNWLLGWTDTIHAISSIHVHCLDMQVLSIFFGMSIYHVRYKICNQTSFCTWQLCVFATEHLFGRL